MKRRLLLSATFASCILITATAVSAEEPAATDAGAALVPRSARDVNSPLCPDEFFYSDPNAPNTSPGTRQYDDLVKACMAPSVAAAGTDSETRQACSRTLFYAGLCHINQAESGDWFHKNYAKHPRNRFVLEAERLFSAALKLSPGVGIYAQLARAYDIQDRKLASLRTLTRALELALQPVKERRPDGTEHVARKTDGREVIVQIERNKLWRTLAHATVRAPSYLPSDIHWNALPPNASLKIEFARTSKQNAPPVHGLETTTLRSQSFQYGDDDLPFDGQIQNVVELVRTKQSIPFAPGNYNLTLSAPGYESVTWQVFLGQGEPVIELRPLWLLPAGRPKSWYFPSQRAVAWSSIGLGSALTIAGAVLGARWWSEYSKWNSSLEDQTTARYDTMRRDGDFSVAFMSAGLLTAGAGLVLLLVRPNQPEGTLSATTQVTPSLGGVSVTSRF